MTDDAAAAEAGTSHRHEPHTGSLSARLNWLRAGVLGANDGIVSTGALVVGVAAATASSSAIATAGVAGLAAGAVSMALGEYVSVSTQRDTEKASVARERGELERMPKVELQELIGLLEQRGLGPPTAQTVAAELTEHDALAAHLALELGINREELGINREELANPWAAAGASAIFFTLGALIPLLAIITPPASARIAAAFLAVLFALALTGALSAQLGGSPKPPAMIRLVAGGALAMIVTYAVGELLEVAVN